MELALEGDTTALRLCLERILSPRNGRPISFDLPDLTNSGDVRAAALSLLRSVAVGDVTPEDGRHIIMWSLSCCPLPCPREG